MRKLILFILLLIYSCFFTQNIYVSANGKDRNNGSKNSPVYSIQTALDIAIKYQKNPVTINIASGNYYIDKPLVLDNRYSRNKNNKIQIIGNSKKNPIFFGGKSIKPIVNQTTKYWEIDVSECQDIDKVMSFITVNGVMRAYSRYPNEGFIKPLKVDYTDKTIIVKIPTELNEILNKYSPAEVKNTLITFYVKWTDIIWYIHSYNYKESTIEFNDVSLPDIYKIVANETLFKVNNLKKNLNEGEWYLENKKIIYKPFPSENPDSSLLVVPTVNHFIIANGTSNNNISYIEFKNLSYNTAGQGLPKSGYYPYQAATAVDAVFDFKYSSNLNFTNLKVNNISNYAFWFQEGCENINITNSQFHNLGAGAIKIGNVKYSSDILATNNITIKNNLIEKGGLVYPDAVSINIINAFSNTISHNTISDFTYTGISIGWVWGYEKSLSKNNMISYNHIYNIGKGILDDMGGIYTLGISPGTVIKNNVIHDIYDANYGGWGIYTDEGSSNILIENNLVYNCKSAGFHQHYGKDNIIRNNIFALNGESELVASKIEDHNSFYFTNNIIIHKNNDFFAANWLNVKKKSDHNIYYSLSGQESENKISEVGSLYINPELKKNNFYYEIINKSTIKKINFKDIDFSQVGADIKSH